MTAAAISHQTKAQEQLLGIELFTRLPRGLRAERLMDEDLFPVCSPSLLDGPHPLRRMGGLRHPTPTAY